MESAEQVTVPPNRKKPQIKRTLMLKKVDLDTAKQIQQFKDRVNKKTFGRKVKDSEVLALAVSLLGTEHVLKLQESTYSEKDRLSMIHEDYQKAHGKLSLEQFIGKILRGEVQIPKQ